MTAENFSGRIDDLEEYATSLALGDDPVHRCYGRLLLAGAAGCFDTFFTKESDAKTPILEILLAVTKFGAEMTGSVLRAMTPEGRDQASALAANVFSAYLAEAVREGGVA